MRIQHVMAAIICLQLLKLDSLMSDELMSITFRTFSLPPVILAGTVAIRAIHIVLSVILYVWLTYGRWTNPSLHIAYGIWCGLIILDFFVSPKAVHAPIFYFSFAMLILLDKLIFSYQVPSNMRRLTILFIYGMPVWMETLLIVYKSLTFDVWPELTFIQLTFIGGNFICFFLAILSIL